MVELSQILTQTKEGEEREVVGQIELPHKRKKHIS